MLDTLMALWNQDRRKRAVQAILIFFLMCISISLLLVITSRSLTSQYKQQKASTGSASPTVPTFGNTVVPNLTPTVSVVVGTQPTPVATTVQPTPVATTTQPTPVATTTQLTPVSTATQPTPVSTATQPCPATPSGATSHASTFYADALLQPSPTPQRGSGTPNPPHKHFDGGGGGPVNTITPVLPTPTPVPPSTPTPVIPSTPTPAPAQHGWVPNCVTSNSLSTVTGSGVIALLAQNIWFILGSALLCTTLFYAMLFAIKHRMRV